jgi:hypothetical protein
MELLDDYLKHVKSYLPAKQRDDIVAELSANIRSQMDDSAAELGRPLTESEQAAILLGHGSPIVVAGRYRVDHRGVAFGPELIGPELFPHYLKTLSLICGITLLPFLVGAVATGSLATISAILFPMSIQFAVVTLVFALLNISERTYQRWPAPAAYLRPIPRWQSSAGLAVWTCCILWLLLVPRFPYLIFGPAAANVTLAPGWQPFYAAILTLLLAGLIQRSVNLIHPDWTLVLPATRLAVNGLGVATLYFFRHTDLVAAMDRTPNLAHYRRLAEILNAAILRGLLGYLLINTAIYAVACFPHLRQFMLGRRARARSEA